MSRQFVNPYLVQNDQTVLLTAYQKKFEEDWLQKFVYTHSQAIPIDEIEPAFGPLVPICRELPTHAGPVDLLLLNKLGLPTLIECKLWKNPEARRQVIGQILDYAKELSKWSYEDLENSIARSKTPLSSPLYQYVCGENPQLTESDFIDNVCRNLKRGRFLLIILGDGIRENVEQITDFLQKHAYLNFSFSLVEFALFSVPGQTKAFFVQPRVIAQTFEIERAVFRIEDGHIISEAPKEDQDSFSRKRTKISEQVFWESLVASETTKDKLKRFLKELKLLGVNAKPGENSIILKSDKDDINFGVINIKGEFENKAIGSKTISLGWPQIGKAYIEHLAKLVNGYADFSSKDPFRWTVKKSKGKNSPKVTLEDILIVDDQVLSLIQNTLDQILDSSQ